MFVINRQNNKEKVSFDKILNRLKSISTNLSHVDCALLTKKIIERMYCGITTSNLDKLSSQLCMESMSVHPDYGELACRICVSNLHKNTSCCLFETYNRLYNLEDSSGNKYNLVNCNVISIIKDNLDVLNKIVDYDRDYTLDYFGFKTLERSYLLKVDDVIIERPQHMFMRVSISIHGEDMEKVKNTYDKLSKKYFTHATPTLFNAGTEREQMSSCFLAGMDDNIESIFETTGELAKISKWSGGIGLSISNIRSNGSLIRGTGGKSSGIMPLLKMLNATANYINQGGKRNGSFAVYLEPHHPDIFTFLDSKKNHGAEEHRARDLFYALWVSDLFMERVEKDQDWCLMCPDRCRGLNDVYGDEFKELYERYEKESVNVTKRVKARKVWHAIVSSQIETGVPYILYKDACNKKSNQKNVGTIKSSNLCAEIIEYSDSKETAVCNLASICLPKVLETTLSDDYLELIPTKQDKNIVSSMMKDTVALYSKDECVYCSLVKELFERHNINYKLLSEEEDLILQKLYPGRKYNTVPRVYLSDEMGGMYVGGYERVWELLKPRVNYQKLSDISGTLVDNLNKIIDNNFYPTEKTRKSNMRHRPIGIGVQGLADLFISLRIGFDSDEAKEVNKKLFESIYYGAMKMSIELAKTRGSYDTYFGSPLSNGMFQFDLWGIGCEQLSGLWDWKKLRVDLLKNGARNSLLIALMPTASTSQIMGNNECIEPYTSNLYVRRTLAGEFTVVNKHLVKDLITLGLWNDNTIKKLLITNGSISNMKEIPKFLRDVYKTVWEIKQKKCIELSAERAPFVCQSQSLNIWLEKPDFNSLTSIHFYGWKNGLKTGSYYIRSKPKVSPQKFGVSYKDEKEMIEKENEECVSCSG